ncbi:hypothetical protein N7478_011930 [Penicillium angulare]|uniref:uncharacterized protein n=1 Tax=Penicillium angulare TaxID=116970 RepID=UPI00253F84AF|nr:uncharacterized protein N7478_011930 [Penicillium angulare]KAJ5261335.1 hypothetical protein N7478_011930 [Penicillium angulare]
MFSRKGKRGKHEAYSKGSSTPGASTKDHLTPSKATLFSRSKALFRGSVAPRVQEEDAKGPLGLDLLHSPAVPEVDFIFVHGLGGGSRKTWSKSSLDSHFWPKEWLAKDPAFKHVRIHSYGYEYENMKGRQDALNVDGIGKSLLAAISTSANIASSGTHIVVIGHSMGGLAMKKALTLASQDPLYREISERFSALFFLGTPHRGAKSSKMLKNLLKVSYDRGYVDDLEPNSHAIQVINDGFRHLSAEIELWSFYETQNMRFFSSLIVDSESATIGSHGEKQIPMTADHRSICRFETPEDPNYILLRNALASAVSTQSEAKLKDDRKKNQHLRKFIGVSSVIYHDLASIGEVRIDGTCTWISTKLGYIDWRDGPSSGAKVLWINGQPGAGKSVLAAYIIERLKADGQDCSFFFFKRGDDLKANLSCCLRSLAFQMASSNPDAGRQVLEIQRDYDCMDAFDDDTIWQRLLSSGIFQVLKSRHYWVIDGLDECPDSLNFLKGMLSKMDHTVPIRILITGRDAVDLQQGFSQIPPRLLQQFSISTADTKSDMNLLIQERMGVIEVMSRANRWEVAQKILDKSEGSFMWTILVLDELFRCTSRKQCDKVIEDMPRGMDPLYNRTLVNLAQARHGKELAKIIFMWAACAVRPLTIAELDNALTLDFNDSFQNLENAIFLLCGQLVVVDTTNRLKMVHESARGFLLDSRSASEFRIDEVHSHTQMANVCLQYLTGLEIKPPRSNRSRLPADLAANRQDFATYAYTAFSYHLSRADPKSSETLKLLMKFLKSNVFTWIETIAASENLYHLVTASRRLQTYASSCASVSLKDPRIEELRQWATDFARIPAMFANSLSASPSSIHTVIPPFCPTRSMVYNNGNSRPRIEVLGASNPHWNSRVMSINFPQGPPRIIRYGEHFLAVGFMSGSFILYHIRSYEEYKILDHGEMVQFIAFKPNSDLLATCGVKVTKIWDVKCGEVVHIFDSPSRPLGIVWDSDKLLISSSDNYVATWTLDQGTLSESEPIKWNTSDTEDDTQKPSPGTPAAMDISTSHAMLAVAYSRQPIMLWDLEKTEYKGTCGKKQSNGEVGNFPIVTLVFNPNPDLRLLAALYMDGGVVVLDPKTNRQVTCSRANCQNIASSPDGRRLAASAANGIIQVYEFASLKLIYQVNGFDSYIKDLAFSTDSMHLADVRANQCTVWAPLALGAESRSDSKTDSSFTPVFEEVSIGSNARINAIAVHHTSDVIFAGKADGLIELYDRKTAESLGSITTHKAAIHLLSWIQRKDCLLSVDASSKIILHRIRKSDKGWLGGQEVIFNHRLDIFSAIVDVLVDETNGKLMVSTCESDHLFDIESQECEKEERYELTDKTRKWLLDPTSSSRLIRAESKKLCMYTWSDFSECSSLSLPVGNDMVDLKGANIYQFGGRQAIILELLSISGSKITIIDEDCLPVQDTRPKSESGAKEQLSAGTDVKITRSFTSIPSPPQVIELELDATHILGIYESKLVFLTRSSWVCSVELPRTGLSLSEYSNSQMLEIHEHFFIPRDWFIGQSKIPCVISKDDVILTRGGDLAVIRGGLQHTERVVQKSR